jgi:hypothetical protein
MSYLHRLVPRVRKTERSKLQSCPASELAHMDMECVMILCRTIPSYIRVPRAHALLLRDLKSRQSIRVFDISEMQQLMFASHSFLCLLRIRFYVCFAFSFKTSFTHKSKQLETCISDCLSMYLPSLL